MNRWIVRAAPVLIAIVLLAAFWATLRTGQNTVSPWVGRPAPAQTLPARPDGPIIDLQEALADGPVIVNFWASWCGPCRIEHPFLQELADEGVRIIGVEFRDQPETADQFLRALGDPFYARAADFEGRTGFDWGVTGVPETFIIDRNGVVRAHFQHPLNATLLDREVRPLLEELN